MRPYFELKLITNSKKMMIFYR